MRVIGGDNLVSDERHAAPAGGRRRGPADAGQDVIKLAMLDRYGADAPAAIGFLQGYGLKRGALGTTYNPMYHNVLVAGVDDDATWRTPPTRWPRWAAASSPSTAARSSPCRSRSAA